MLRIASLSCLLLAAENKRKYVKIMKYNFRISQLFYIYISYFNFSYEIGIEIILLEGFNNGCIDVF